MRISFLWGVVFSATLIGSTQAAAQEDARALFTRGQTAYQQGDYETAVSAWNRAYELDARPLIQYNLAQAYERLGRLQDAAQALDRYLETAEPGDQYQADARARRSALRERLSRTGITVRGGPDGAIILIDGQEWGRTPRPDRISVDPGSHQVVVRHDGYRDFTAAVVVPAGQSVEIAVNMEEAPVDSDGGAGPSPQASGTNIWPYVLLGAGGALTAGGLLFGAAALGKANDAPDKNSPEADSARGLAAAADVCFVLGIAAAGSGLVWLILSDDGEVGPGETAFSVTPLVSPDGAGANARVTF
jgi:tetratricopeptide (TPR) repeat protein